MTEPATGFARNPSETCRRPTAVGPISRINSGRVDHAGIVQQEKWVSGFPVRHETLYGNGRRPVARSQSPSARAGSEASPTAGSLAGTAIVGLIGGLT